MKSFEKHVPTWGLCSSFSAFIKNNIVVAPGEKRKTDGDEDQQKPTDFAMVCGQWFWATKNTSQPGNKTDPPQKRGKCGVKKIMENVVAFFCWFILG